MRAPLQDGFWRAEWTISEQQQLMLLNFPVLWSGTAQLRSVTQLSKPYNLCSANSKKTQSGSLKIGRVSCQVWVANWLLQFWWRMIKVRKGILFVSINFQHGSMLVPFSGTGKNGSTTGCHTTTDRYLYHSMFLCEFPFEFCIRNPKWIKWCFFIKDKKTAVFNNKLQPSLASDIFKL